MMAARSGNSLAPACSRLILSSPDAFPMMRILTLLLSTLLLAGPVFGQTTDQAVAPLVEGARAAMAELPDSDLFSAAARLAESQARLGDVFGARETARTLGRDSWWSYARVAIAQKNLGDPTGALETTQSVPELTARAQAMGSLASSYIGSGDLEMGEGIIRQIEWPKQQIEGLRVLAGHVRGDTARARAYLRDAVQIASQDTSQWGRYFWVELAYMQAAHGDLAGALRILSDTLLPNEHAERTARIARELQRANHPRAPEVADSLFRESLRWADRVPPDAEPSAEATRERVFRSYRAYASPASLEMMLSETRTDTERTEALVQVVVGAAAPPAQPLRGLDAARELEARGEHRGAARALTRLLAWIVLRDGGLGPDDVLTNATDTLVHEALRLARHHSAALADSIRLELITTISGFDWVRARPLVDGLRDPHLRSLAIAQVASSWARDRVRWTPEPDTADDGGAARYAAAIPDPEVRDQALEDIARASAYHNPDMALWAAREIQSPKVKALALAHVAEWLKTSDASRARALYAELLPLLDPLDVKEPSLRNPGVALSLYQMGEVQMLARWAAGQRTPERRAEAYLQMLEAAVALRGQVNREGAGR